VQQLDRRVPAPGSFVMSVWVWMVSTSWLADRVERVEAGQRVLEDGMPICLPRILRMAS
jgi:hypothetical protein